MKKLLYKGVKFDSFAFSNSEGTEYLDESTETYSLKGFEDGGWAYICPYCIKRAGFYEETDLSEKEVNDTIAEEEKYGYTEPDYVCCVAGCNNRNAYDISFRTGDCEIVD